MAQYILKPILDVSNNRWLRFSFATGGQLQKVEANAYDPAAETIDDSNWEELPDDLGQAQVFSGFDFSINQRVCYCWGPAADDVPGVFYRLRYQSVTQQALSRYEAFMQHPGSAWQFSRSGANTSGDTTIINQHQFSWHFISDEQVPAQRAKCRKQVNGLPIIAEISWSAESTIQVNDLQSRVAEKYRDQGIVLSLTETQQLAVLDAIANSLRELMRECSSQEIYVAALTGVLSGDLTQFEELAAGSEEEVISGEESKGDQLDSQVMQHTAACNAARHLSFHFAPININMNTPDDAGSRATVADVHDYLREVVRCELAVHAPSMAGELKQRELPRGYGAIVAGKDFGVNLTQLYTLGTLVTDALTTIMTSELIDIGTKAIYLKRAVSPTCKDYYALLDKLYASHQDLDLIKAFKQIRDLCFNREVYVGGFGRRKILQWSFQWSESEKINEPGFQAAVRDMVNHRMREIALHHRREAENQSHIREVKESSIVGDSAWRAIVEQQGRSLGPQAVIDIWGDDDLVDFEDDDDSLGDDPEPGFLLLGGHTQIQRLASHGITRSMLVNACRVISGSGQRVLHVLFQQWILNCVDRILDLLVILPNPDALIQILSNFGLYHATSIMLHSAERITHETQFENEFTSRVFNTMMTAPEDLLCLHQESIFIPGYWRLADRHPELTVDKMIQIKRSTRLTNIELETYGSRIPTLCRHSSCLQEVFRVSEMASVDFLTLVGGRLEELLAHSELFIAYRKATRKSVESYLAGDISALQAEVDLYKNARARLCYGMCITEQKLDEYFSVNELQQLVSGHELFTSVEDFLLLDDLRAIEDVNRRELFFSDLAAFKFMIDNFGRGIMSESVSFLRNTLAQMPSYMRLARIGVKTSELFKLDAEVRMQIHKHSQVVVNLVEKFAIPFVDIASLPKERLSAVLTDPRAAEAMSFLRPYFSYSPELLAKVCSYEAKLQSNAASTENARTLSASHSGIFATRRQLAAVAAIKSAVENDQSVHEMDPEIEFDTDELSSIYADLKAESDGIDACISACYS